MPAEWPESTARGEGSEEAREYTIRVLSREAEARRWPSLENLTQETAREWARRVWARRYGR